MKLKDYTQGQRGRAAKLAGALGVRPVMVHQWANGAKQIPVGRCMAVERATDGLVTRRDLRPHDFFDHWPDLVSSDTVTRAHAGESGASAHA